MNGTWVMSDLSEPTNDNLSTPEYIGVLLPKTYPPPADLPYSSNKLDYSTFKVVDDGGGYDYDWFSLTIPQGVQHIRITITPESFDGSNYMIGGLSIYNLKLLWSLQDEDGQLSFDNDPDNDFHPTRVEAIFDVTSLFEYDEPLVTFKFAAWGIKSDHSGNYDDGHYSLNVDFVKYVDHPTNSIDDTFNPLEYIASYPDLIAALGPSAGKGLSHWIAYGRNEGRATTFDGLQYIASYDDLIKAFGLDRDRGAAHYIYAGKAEGRTQDDFDETQYLANYPDLQAAFGNDVQAATKHYITYGFAESRQDEPISTTPDFVL